MNNLWSKFITVPGVYLILGFRGQGKSALGYYLTERLGNAHGLNKIVFGVGEEIGNYLPDDWTSTRKIDFPNDSVILIDEISIVAYARNFQKKENEILDHLVAMSRKKNQLIFMITHHSRKIDVNLVTDVNGIIFKKPSLLHTQLDRKEVQTFSKKAYSILKEKKNSKEWCYIFDFVNDCEIETVNPLPDFWCDELSNMVSVGTEEPEVDPDGEVYIDDLVDFDISQFADYSMDDLWVEIQSYNDNSMRRKLLFDLYLDKAVQSAFNS